MTKPSIWVCLGNIPETYVADAMPPSWREGTPGMLPAGKRRSSRVLSFFLDNGWVAAILSAVVAIGIIVAIVRAGRGEGPVPPVGTVPESETEEETVIPYTLAYTPLGNGTCSVRIVGNPENDRDYDVVIPETSPDGDTVVEVAERQFDHLAPHIMSVEFYKENIVRPLEEYYGLTLEEAEENRRNKNHPQHKEILYFLKYLAHFMHFDETYPHWDLILEVYPELAHGDFYTLETVITDEELLRLSAELARADISPESILSCYDEVDEICGYEKGTSAAKYAPTVHGTPNSGRHIRSVTLPDTVKTVSDQAFLGCVDLQSIDLGDGIEVLGAGVFGECMQLQELRIPASLQEIRPSYIEEYQSMIRIKPTAPFSLYLPDTATLQRCEWVYLIDLENENLSIYVDGQLLTDP